MNSRSIAEPANKLSKSPARRIYRYFLSQTEQVKMGGLPVLLRKAAQFLEFVLALLPLLIVRALRPIILIRVGRLPAESIGSLAAYPEFYLCARDEAKQGPRVLDLFYHPRQICNRQLMKMWSRTLRVSPIAGPLDRLNYRVPGSNAHVAPLIVGTGMDVDGLLSRHPPHLSFTPEEERRGQAGLRGLGVPEGTPFICFLAWDSAYEEVKSKGQQTDQFRFRESTIHNYVQAAEDLTGRGYFAIRMGYLAKDALKTSNPKVIDYATQSRTDFLDIYLAAKCRFFLTGGAGIEQVAEIFRRPLAWVNYPYIEQVLGGGRANLFIPKKLWLRQEQRFLTFREVHDSGIGRLTDSAQFDQRGVELKENTPEEITALAVEMDERIKGTWKPAGEDEELQRRFWSIFEQGSPADANNPRIGASFLRENRELLA